jgi:hypothetical protein
MPTILMFYGIIVALYFQDNRRHLTTCCGGAQPIDVRPQT